jgi:radical SAM protein with 4Fe4S-binding SPASM domain
MNTATHFFEEYVGQRKPRSMAVESSAACNLDCPFCRYGQSAEESGQSKHSDIERKVGNMDLALYRDKILPSAVEFGINRIQLHYYGEPLMNKKLVEMISLGKESGMWMQFFTNGLLMTEKKMDELLDVKVDLVRFSIDGNSQDTYKLNRVGGDFNKVISILSKFAQKARDRKSKIKIEWSYIVTRNNEHEVNGARETAKSIGVDFMAKVLNTHDASWRPKGSSGQRDYKPKPCKDIFTIFSVQWNGDVSLCPYDVEGRFDLGNVGENTIDEIWNSPSYRQIRKRLANARKEPENEPEICKTCLMYR